jgi:hypothetical protein
MKEGSDGQYISMNGREKCIHNFIGNTHREASSLETKTVLMAE